jgi:uncharacterized protein (DUF427 family)
VTDWMWCYENPKEAAARIDELQAAVRKYEHTLLLIAEQSSDRSAQEIARLALGLKIQS